MRGREGVHLIRMKKDRAKTGVPGLRLRRSGEWGFTLVETVVALAILGLVGGAFLHGMAVSSKVVMVSQERVAAESLAKSQVEDTKAQPYVEEATSYPEISMPGDLAGQGYDIDIDTLGNAYLTGMTNSFDLELYHSIEWLNTYNGGPSDAFVAKVEYLSPALLWGCYVGGTDEDKAYGIAVDTFGQIVQVIGSTKSNDLPHPDPCSIYSGNYDAFLARMSATGPAWIGSHYLGGNANDEGFDKRQTNAYFDR